MNSASAIQVQPRRYRRSLVTVVRPTSQQRAMLRVRVNVAPGDTRKFRTVARDVREWVTTTVHEPGSNLHTTIGNVDGVTQSLQLSSTNREELEVVIRNCGIRSDRSRRSHIPRCDLRGYMVVYSGEPA